jgi:hypothetical protein
LQKAVNLHQVHLKFACGNDNTRLPEGLEKPESWPCSD